jgi:threonine synthase
MNALRLEGQKTVAIEIAQQLGWSVPDWVVLPSGNLGNAYALYAGFRMMMDLGLTDRLPRLCAAQAERADPLYRAWSAGRREVEPMKAGETLATAIQIGNPVSAPRAIRALEAMDGVVEEATEDELCAAAARADRTGLYTCPHTAVALAALERLARRGVVRRGERAVVVSTASGLKFTEFKVRYHEGALPGVSSALANPPVLLPPDPGAVLAALDAHAAR